MCTGRRTRRRPRRGHRVEVEDATSRDRDRSSRIERLDFAFDKLKAFGTSGKRCHRVGTRKGSTAGLGGCLYRRGEGAYWQFQNEGNFHIDRNSMQLCYAGIQIVATSKTAFLAKSSLLFRAPRAHACTHRSRLHTHTYTLRSVSPRERLVLCLSCFFVRCWGQVR